MELDPGIIIKIEGVVSTSSQGISKLMQFYTEAFQYQNINIVIDFYSLKWFDANLTAFFEALIFRLEIENNITVSTNLTFLFKQFHVLFRNGYLKHGDYFVEDVEKTTIPLMRFSPSSLQAFSDYVLKQLMGNRGMNYINKNIKHQIHSDLYEVFQNISKHARTNFPCFVCGQYYPKKQNFMLTIVDLGVGFLMPIKEFTKEKVITDIEAIKWALSGRSSKIVNPQIEIGGLGLSGILEYCKENNGVFHVYSGVDFWGSDLENSVSEGAVKLKYDFKGSLLNIILSVTG